MPPGLSAQFVHLDSSAKRSLLNVNLSTENEESVQDTEIRVQALVLLAETSPRGRCVVMSSDFLLPQLSGRLAHLIGQVVIARDCEKLLEKGVRVRS